MKPTVTTMLKQLSSFLKTDASGGRATGTPFTAWNRSHFERWTKPETAQASSETARSAQAKMEAHDKAAFERWTKAPAQSAVAGRRQAVRSNLANQARQTHAMYYM